MQHEDRALTGERLFSRTGLVLIFYTLSWRSSVHRNKKVCVCPPLFPSSWAPLVPPDGVNKKTTVPLWLLATSSRERVSAAANRPSLFTLQHESMVEPAGQSGGVGLSRGGGRGWVGGFKVCAFASARPCDQKRGDVKALPEGVRGGGGPGFHYILHTPFPLLAGWV